MKVHGIHHVTAVSGQIHRNLDFYTGTLGLRLIKKSINQDDVSAYHLFYSDGAGSPGTDLTFFDWPWIQPDQRGTGTIGRTTLRVDGEPSVAWWESYLRSCGLAVERSEESAGRSRVRFEDFEGQRLEFVDGEGLPSDSQPWRVDGLPEEAAYRGLFAVTLQVARPERSARVLTEILGFSLREEKEQEGKKTFVFETGGESSYGQVCLEVPPEKTPGRVGSGGIHHVAFRVPDDAALYDFQKRIEAAGLATSGYVDRYYFHSLYFREPNGILYELATDGPGMGEDEPLETAGSRLSIPPFMESRRQEIEAGLKPLPAPHYGLKPDESAQTTGA